MSDLLIKNGTVVTASDTYQADVYIVGEKVQTIGKNLDVKASKVIDAQGCYLFPGGIDAHTHMDLPFMGTFASDDFESGTLAGLHGGTTTIIDFAFQSHGGTLNTALSQWHEKADGKAVGDYAFHIAVTDMNEKVKTEIKDLVEKKGVTSFKTFMAYKGALMVDDRQILDLFHELKKHGALLTTHAENGDMVALLVEEQKAKGNFLPKFHAISRPEITEEEATGRVMDLAHQSGSPLYIVHMTCEGALNKVREGMKRNQKVYVETCIQYLLLDDSLYDQGFEGSKWVMSPPLRKKKDQDALWAALNHGSPCGDRPLSILYGSEKNGREGFFKNS
jgi:dihydropyrimidinase